jgi:hypothetical protein
MVVWQAPTPARHHRQTHRSALEVSEINKVYQTQAASVIIYLTDRFMGVE